MKTNKWVTFIILVIGASVAMKLSSVKDAFYVPMMDAFDMNNEQFGMTRSIYGIVQMIGYIPAMFLADRFSKKTMIPLSLFALAMIGFYFATIPGYIGLLLVFALLAIFGEMTYWPIMLKAVRFLGTEKEQGRLFGILEGGRGVIDVIVSFMALGIFVYIGSNITGLRASICFYSFALILIAIVSYFVLEPDTIEKSGSMKDDIKNVLVGIKQELSRINIWLLAFIAFFIWLAYAGLTSFIPFLRDIYALPIAMLGAYGIANQYGLKLIGGPTAGVLADKVFKSPLRTMQMAFIGGIIGLIVLRFYPAEGGNVYLGMVLTLGMASFIFMLRALAFAPMVEMRIPKERAGSAMALVCLVGYSSNIFAYAMYGKIIDTHHGAITGYNYIFIIMGASLTMAFILSNIAFMVAKKGRLQEAK